MVTSLAKELTAASPNTMQILMLLIRRHIILQNILGFRSGALLLIYLGIPIFIGKPRRQHLMPFVYRIRIKLASWMAALLSITSRIQLVKFVISSMLNNSFMVYAWPVNLIKTMDKWVRNFIWSRDVDTRKVVTVAWHKVCKPIEEVGLGIRSLRQVNNAAMLKL